MFERWVFHWRLHPPRKEDFIASPLRYASKHQYQYQAAVKLPGSFRLAAGNPRLHGYRIFIGLLVETVLQSLSLSCAPELTRKGIALP